MKPAQVLAAAQVLQGYFPDSKMCFGAMFLEALDAFEGAGDAKKTRVKPDKDEPKDFPEFYAAYPLHKSRRDAAKAYGEALKRAPAGIILSGCQRYAAEMAGTEPKYIKHPGTWLRADCWADAPPTLTLVAQAFEDCSTAAWVRRLEIFAGKTEEPQGTWRQNWGPLPKTEGCKVPESAKKEYLSLYPVRSQKGT